MRLLLCLMLLLGSAAVADDYPVITLKDSNTITFGRAFKYRYVAKKQAEFIEKVSKLQPDEPMYVVMSTPGGSISAGNLFIDTVKAFPNPVHTVTLFSASMGYHTVQSLGTRYILPSGTLMSHRASLSGLSGQIKGEINTRISHIESILLEMDKTAAKRVSLELDTYRQLIYDEYWVTGEAAVKSGHADAVVRALCDESLSGTRVEYFNSMFGQVVAEFSRCPLVVGPINITRGSDEAREWLSEQFENMNNYVTTEL